MGPAKGEGARSTRAFYAGQRRYDPNATAGETPSRPDRRFYRDRNLFDRFFNKLKHFPAVATRYDKLAENHLAGAKLASARTWMRANESMA